MTRTGKKTTGEKTDTDQEAEIDEIDKEALTRVADVDQRTEIPAGNQKKGALQVENVGGGIQIAGKWEGMCVYIAGTDVVVTN